MVKLTPAIQLERYFNPYLVLCCIVVGIVATVVGNSTLIQQLVVLLWSFTMLLVALKPLGKENRRLATQRFLFFLALTLISSACELFYYAKYTGKSETVVATGLIIAASLIRVVIFGYGWLAMLTDLSRREKVTGRTLASAAIAYLFIAVIWSYIYLVVWHIDSKAFLIADLTEYEFRPWNLTMYFSLVTLTTVGYGGIIPVDRWVMVIASFEAIFGAFYLTIVVARLVSLFGNSN